MAIKASISRASELYYGSVYDPVLFRALKRQGVQFHPISKVSLGSPAALDADGMISAATSTELPNAETITYTTTDDGISPFDNVATPATSAIDTQNGSVSVWKLDVPRNLTIAVTHDTSIVAMSVTVSGYDQYMKSMTETLSVTATGTSKTAAGLKAFLYIESIAITSAGNATTNTLNLGWGDVLGLPYKITSKADVMQAWFNQVLETTAPTVVVGDATTPTSTTGDVRGTIDLNSACNGSAVDLYMVTNPDTRSTLLGTTQA